MGLRAYLTGWFGSAHFVADAELAVFLPVADAFSALLRGEIAWEAATSPVI